MKTSVKNGQLPKDQSSLSLDAYYGYDLFSGTSFASQSVPASRRNSAIEKSFFDYSMTLEHDAPINFLNKVPPRSSSFDVGSINYNFLNLFHDDESENSLDTNSQPNLYQNGNVFRSSTPDFGFYTTQKPSFQIDSIFGKSNKYWSMEDNQFFNQHRPFQDVQAAFYGSTARQFSHGWTPPLKTPPMSYTQFLQPQPQQHSTDGAHLQELQGKLYEICKDQNGCRFLQSKLDESPMYVDFIFEELSTHFADLMKDPFGNYLCQRLLERCNEQQRTIMIEIISPEFLSICLSLHGTRVVQKLLGLLTTKTQIQAVATALKPCIVALVRDWNGHHVIQKCLQKFDSENNQYIYDVLNENCVEVASHKSGCCIYQRCIDKAEKSQKAQLLKAIVTNALSMVEDSFGNYVLQYVLELDDPSYCEELISKFIDSICELSVQKFSSNVMEKCIQVASKETRRKLISAVIDYSNIEQLLRDSYANYVIQTCLDYAEEDQRAQLVQRIRPLLPSIRNTPYGKRISHKISNNDFDGRTNQRNTGRHYQGKKFHSWYK